MEISLHRNAEAMAASAYKARRAQILSDPRVVEVPRAWIHAGYLKLDTAPMFEGAVELEVGDGNVHYFRLAAASIAAAAQGLIEVLQDCWVETHPTEFAAVGAAVLSCAHGLARYTGAHPCMEPQRELTRWVRSEVGGSSLQHFRGICLGYWRRKDAGLRLVTNHGARLLGAPKFVFLVETHDGLHTVITPGAIRSSRAGKALTPLSAAWEAP